MFKIKTKNLVITDSIRYAKHWVIDQLEGKRIIISQDDRIITNSEKWIIVDNEIEIRGMVADNLYVLGNVDPDFIQSSKFCLMCAKNPKVIEVFNYCH